MIAQSNTLWTLLSLVKPVVLLKLAHNLIDLVGLGDQLLELWHQLGF